MGDDKVDLTTETADYSNFKVINVDETASTGLLTFHNCEGRITRKDEEKKQRKNSISPIHVDAVADIV